MKAWSVYLAMQNAFAYGDGVPNAGPASAEEARIVAEYCARLNAIGRLQRSLVIGPGGPREVAALLPSLPGEVCVLTAHAPEVAKIQAELPPAVQVHLGDMHDMPFENGAFDFVFASNVLEHALAPYAALMQIRRVLKDGGVANLVLPDFAGFEGGTGPFHLHCLDERVWKELLRKTGLPAAEIVRQESGNPEACACYWHFRCVAGGPPTPHDRVLEGVRGAHA